MICSFKLVLLSRFMIQIDVNNFCGIALQLWNNVSIMDHPNRLGYVYLIIGLALEIKLNREK